MNVESTITTVTGIIVGVLISYHNYKINHVIKQNKQIKSAVDGPLGLALKSIADAAEKEARRTLDPEDVTSAHDARRRSDDHEKQQGEIAVEKAHRLSDATKLLAEDEAEKKSKAP